MRTKHPSDQAFDTWVDGADQLRTHSVQAAFRGGWEANGAAEITAELLAALEGVIAYADHDQDEAYDGCDGDCEAAVRLWIEADRLARAAVARAKERQP